jgi:hypothetical protein
MKKLIIGIIFLLPLIFFSLDAWPQCDPMTPEQCPDPENNGEVCPDTLAVAYINQFYSQVATIKPPAVYYMPPDSTEITLHHVKLMEVGNMPPGITWISNAADSVFIAGEYYCVLMEGAPDSAGEFALHIVVDVYILFFGVPVNVATVTDSTSLSLVVVDNTGINGNDKLQDNSGQVIPNPFRSETSIIFTAEKAGRFSFEIYSLLGERVYSEQSEVSKGENTIFFDGADLRPGTYFYNIRFDNYQKAGIMIRAD